VTLKHRGLDWIGLRLSVISNRYNYPLYAAIERDHGLLRDEAAVILCLSLLGDGQTAQDIVGYTARPKNTVSRAVRKLEAGGTIRRHGDSSDARASRLYLTDDGLSLVQGIKAYYLERDKKVIGALTASERREFNRLLVKIADASKTWV
jgi:DNA-binding MarR family transcriptional regulator